MNSLPEDLPLRYNDAGLIPVITQAHDTLEVLMMAWMSREAVEETLRTGEVTYFSRSRKGLWRKGERSGQVQKLVDFRVDCDNDSILLLVRQVGVACHTGRRNCFYRSVKDGESVELFKPLVNPSDLYG